MLVSLTAYLIVDAAALDRRTMLSIASVSVVVSLAAAAVFQRIESRLLGLVDRLTKRWVRLEK